jgi:phosphoglycerate dehydrogenase-like enzyme
VNAAPRWILITLALAVRVAPAAAPEFALAPSASVDIGRVIEKIGIRIADQPVRLRPGWWPPRTILLAEGLHEQRVELERIAPGVKFVEVNAATPAADLAAADAAFGVCTPELLLLAGHLQWIQWLAAGVERCVQVPGVRERHLLLTNMQRVFGASMAEHVIGLMLVLSRHLDLFISAQQRAHAFGMRVIATRASGKMGPEYVSYVGLPNVVITPHLAASSTVADEIKRALLRENLRRYVAGEPMLSVVDVERGY